MQQPKAFNIDADVLASSSAPSDRLVTLSHFVPFNLGSYIEDEPYAMTPSQIDLMARSVALISHGEKARALKSTLPSRVREAAEQWRNRGDIGTAIEADPLLNSSVTAENQMAGQFGTEFGLMSWIARAFGQKALVWASI